MSLQPSLGKGGDTLYPGIELGPNQVEEPEVITHTSLFQTDVSLNTVPLCPVPNFSPTQLFIAHDLLTW